MNKQVDKKTTKIEQIMMGTMILLVIITPIIALTLSSINLVNVKQISSTEQQIELVKQEVTELEVKKQEKITYEQVHEYAAAGGLEKNEERVQKVRVD